LKLVFSSATIESGLFHRFFNEPEKGFSAQKVEVEGR
jgi:HrpA-like RNA helicase